MVRFISFFVLCVLFIMSNNQVCQRCSCNIAQYLVYCRNDSFIKPHEIRMLGRHYDTIVIENTFNKSFLAILKKSFFVVERNTIKKQECKRKIYTFEDCIAGKKVPTCNCTGKR